MIETPLLGSITLRLIASSIPFNTSLTCQAQHERSNNREYSNETSAAHNATVLATPLHELGAPSNLALTEEAKPMKTILNGSTSTKILPTATALIGSTETKHAKTKPAP